MIKPIKLLIADQDKQWRETLIQYLRSNIRIASFDYGGSREVVLELAQKNCPDIIIFDPDQSWNNDHGLILAYEILNLIKTKIIILTSSTDPELIRDAFAIGIINYVFKESYYQLSDVIISCFKKNTPLQVLSKDYQRLRRESVLRKLTDAEIQVFALIQEDYSANKIAKELCKEYSTVKSQIQSIYRKLDVGSRNEALNIIASNEITSKYKRCN